MTPRERIQEIAFQKYGRPCGGGAREIQAEDWAQATIDYLVEHQELERRLVYLRSALQLVQPMMVGGGSDTQVNGYLEKAGLSLRVYEGSSVDLTIAQIISAAEEAGLL